MSTLCGRVRWLAGDPDPLPNTVTATYTARTGTPFESSDTDTASASTNLFQPGVDVTKTCTPNPVLVGEAVTCTIVVTDTSSDDGPALVNGTIVDSLTGNLLAAGNTAVVSSNCTAALPDPAGARREPARSSHGARCWPPTPTGSATR